MRAVAVFNDTAPHRHFGCEAVMAAIEANVAARSARIVYRHPVGQPWQTDPNALAAIEQADVVLVNGEGTIHHSQPGAVSLAQLGPHCTARGKPCFMINAMIQANNQSVMADLAAFTGIWVRDGRSAEEVQRWKLAADVCGDLSFYHSMPRHEDRRERGLVLDSPDPKLTAKMAKVAAALRADFVSMRHNKKGMKAFKKDLVRWRYETGKPGGIVAGITTFQQFAAFLARRRFVVTARFHGLCFAVNCRVPFSVVSPNVWKSEALLSDIGLGSARRFRSGTTPGAFTANEMELISTYVADIRNRIAAMFDRILPDGRRRG